MNNEISASGTSTTLPIYPVAQIMVVSFDKVITNKNGLTADGKSNIYIELTNAPIFSKRGFVRFHWLSGATSSAFTIDDVIGEPVDLSGYAVGIKVTIQVPLALLQKASDNGGRAGIYYQYLEENGIDPMNVGMPENPSDNRLSRSQSFEININALNFGLKKPVPAHDSVSANDLDTGFRVTIPDYVGKNVHQTIDLHWKQTAETIIGPHKVTSSELHAPVDIELTTFNVTSPEDGPVEIFYTVNEGAQYVTSPSVSISYGTENIQLIAPVLPQSSAGVIDVSKLHSIEVDIQPETPPVALRDVTLFLEGLNESNVVQTQQMQRKAGYVTVPAKFSFNLAQIIRPAVVSLRAYYTINNNLKYVSHDITVTVEGCGISETGTLYGAGFEKNSNLGGQNSSSNQTALSELSPELKVKFLPYGGGRYSHSVIGQDGHLYSWGENNSGETGNGQDGVQTRAQAQFVGAQPRIVFVSNGAHHTLALDEEGTLWGAGSTDFGRLAMDGFTGKPLNQFEQSQTGIKFSFVCAGSCGGGEWDSTSSLGIGKEDGLLYGWGKSATGVLGQGISEVPATWEPRLVDPSRKWQWVCHNFKRAAGITRDGALFTWGEEDGSGVLGRGTVVRNVTSPSEVVIRSNDGERVMFTRVYTGQKFMIALDTRGHVWGWGKNEGFALAGAGRQDEAGIPPTLIPNLNDTYVDIAADWGSAAALNTSGVICVWGNNQHSQLGLNRLQNYVSSPAQIVTSVRFSRITFGCFALFALAKQGR